MTDAVPSDTIAFMESDSEWQQAHDALLETYRPRDLPTLYHYTSVAGALAILQTGTLWLSSHSAMNDHAEGRWLPDALIARMANRPNLRESSVFNALWQVAVAPYEHAYLTCFSEEGDLLSQWRAYAQDGEGIAVGFNPNDGRIPVIDAPPHTNAGVDMGLTISQVQYMTDGASTMNLFEAALAADIGSREFQAAQALIIQERWRTKNPAFKEEREWRAINLPMEFDGDIGGGNTAVSTVGSRRFREAGGRMVSYYQVPFRDDAVVEIVLGPQCRVQQAELAMLFRDRNLNPTVRPSQATYRR